VSVAPFLAITVAIELTIRLFLRAPVEPNVKLSQLARRQQIMAAVDVVDDPVIELPGGCRGFLVEEYPAQVGGFVGHASDSDFNAGST